MKFCFQDMISNKLRWRTIFVIFLLNGSDHTQLQKVVKLVSPWIFYIWSRKYKIIWSNKPTFLACGSLQLWHLNYLNITTKPNI